MSLPTFALNEPLITALVGLLQSQLPAQITAFNASVTDNIPAPAPAQYLPYVPYPGAMMGGLPIVGVRDLPATFEDDLQFRIDAVHELAVVCVVQEADHQTLVWQLRRLVECVAQTIQADRLAGNPPGTASVMKTQGGAWAVEFVGTEPGPLLGDVNPESPAEPPSSYLSWTTLVLRAKRAEVG